MGHTHGRPTRQEHAAPFDPHKYRRVCHSISLWNNVSTNTVNSCPASPESVQSGQMLLTSWTSEAIDSSLDDFKITQSNFKSHLNMLPVSIDPLFAGGRRLSEGSVIGGCGLGCDGRRRKSRSRVDGARTHVHGERSRTSSLPTIEIELSSTVDFDNL